MDKDERSIYGTTTAEPDARAGVEVGGGEKPAAERQAEKRDRDEKPGSETRHEARSEGPHADREHTNKDATPGAGTLPDGDQQDATNG